MRLNYNLLFLVLLNIICHSVQAQSEWQPKSTKISASKCGETGYYLVTKKNKTGLYNPLTETYIISPVENFFYYFDTYSLLFESSEIGTITIYNLGVEEPTKSTFKNIIANRLLLHSFGTFNFEQNNLIWQNSYVSQFLNGKLISLPDSSKLINESTKKIDYNERFSFGLERIKNSIIITDFHDLFLKEPLRAIASIEYPGEDSMSTDNMVLYYPRTFGYQRSGVFNLTTKTWDVPKNYCKIVSVKNLFICQKIGQSEIVETDNYYYDFYYQKDENIIPTNYIDIQFNGGFPFELLFENDWYSLDRDSSYVSFKSKDKVGIAKIQLFQTYWSDHSYNSVEISTPNLKLDTLILPENDFVLKSGRDHISFVKSVNNVYTYLNNSSYEDTLIKNPIEFTAFFCVENYSIGKTYFIDNQFYKDTSSTETPKLIGIDSIDLINLDFEKIAHVIDDSLIYIQHWIKEEGATYTDAGPSKRYENYDAEGSYSFYAPAAGEYESGIYDRKNNLWFIKPEQAYILFNNDGYLVCHPVLNENGNLYNYEYLVKNKNNDVLKLYASYEKWLESSEFMQFTFPQFEIESQQQINEIDSNYYYFQCTDKKMGVVDKMQSRIIIEPSDFVYFNPLHNLKLDINNNVIQFKIREYSTEINLNQALNLDIKYISELGNYVIIDNNTASVLEINPYKGTSKSYPFAGSKVQTLLLSPDATKESLQLKMLSQELIYIEDFEDLYVQENVEMPENYLYDFKGEVTRTISIIPGHCRSGILNITTNEWLIQPTYCWIKQLEDNHYFAKKIVFTNTSISLESYSLFDSKGAIIFENKTKNELSAEYKILVN